MTRPLPIHHPAPLHIHLISDPLFGRRQYPICSFTSQPVPDKLGVYEMVHQDVNPD